MKLKAIKNLIENKSENEREKYFQDLITNKRNKAIDMHRDYYEGNHWNIKTGTEKTGLTRSGKAVFGKAPSRIPLKDDKLDRKSSDVKEIEFSSGQLQKRNYIKFFIQFYQEFICGTDKEEILVTYEPEVQEDLTNDEASITGQETNPQDGSIVTQINNGNVQTPIDQSEQANSDEGKQATIEEINKLLKSLWKSPEKFAKKQVAKMVVTTVGVNALEYDPEDERYYVSVVDANEIYPIYRRDQRVGTLRTYFIDKDEAELMYDTKLETKQNRTTYAEIFYKEDDEVYFVKFVNGKPIYDEEFKQQGNNIVIKIEDEKTRFDPYDIVNNIDHAFRDFDDNSLADSEIFEWIDQNDSLNAQKTIEHIASLFIAQPKTSLDWDAIEKMQLDIESDEFKQAVHEFDWMPNTLDSIPVKVLDAKDLPQAFQNSKEDKVQALHEDAGVPLIMASGSIPSNLGVETLQLSYSRLNRKISQKREVIAELIKKTSMKMLLAKGVIDGDEMEEMKNIKVHFPNSDTFSAKDLMEFLFRAVEKGLIPDEYATQVYLEMIGKQDDIEKVVGLKNASFAAIQPLIQREKDTQRKLQLAQEGVIARDQQRINNANNPEAANQFLNPEQNQNQNQANQQQ
jgi:hypothetical protein